MKANRTHLPFVFLVSLLTSILPSAAAVSSWNATADYSGTANPSGAWTYGRKWNPTDTAINAMTVRWGSNGWFLGNYGHGGPSIQGGPSLWAKNNTNGLPCVRWTCPEKGDYRISVTFVGADSRGVDSDVYLVLNGVKLAEGRVRADRQEIPFSIASVSLAKGDVVDHVIRWAGGVNSEYSWTAVQSQIERKRAPIPSGLVAWWRGEDNAADASGFHHGQWQGAPSHAPGMVGRAFAFGGGRIIVPNAPALNFPTGGEASFECWVYRTDGTLPCHVLGKRDGRGEFNYQFGLDSSFPSAPLNTWVHWAWVYEGTTLRIYLDGVLAQTREGRVREGGLGPVNSADLVLGDSGTLNQPLTGFVDEISLYRRALTVDEIRAIHQAGPAGKAYEDLNSKTYFGTFAGGAGHWSMIVNRDGVGTYLAYLNNPNAGIVANVQVASDGSFRTLGTTVQPQVSVMPHEGGRIVAAAASVFTLVGSISSGTVSGSLEGLNATFSGTVDTPSGATASLAGLYQAGGTGGAGTTYAVVGSSERVMALTIGTTLVDGGLGTVGSGGSFIVSTPSSTKITGSVAQTTGAITATVAPVSGTTITVTGALVTTQEAPTRLANCSLLTDIPTAGGNFTLGYVVGGSGTSGEKSLVIRAAGPSLSSFGVGSPLADPTIDLYRGATKTGGNDNWGGATALVTALANVGAFPFSGANSKDSALATNIATGNNSVIVSGVGSSTGSVLTELYDATPANAYTATTPRLVNVSVLKEIGGGLTLGFVVGGRTTRTVLVRAVGPGLAQWGVAGTAADPQLTFYAGTNKVDENDNWGGGAALVDAMKTVSAFALPAASKDAALLTTLQPGSYSVQVASSSGSASGQVLVEVYEIP